MSPIAKSLLKVVGYGALAAGAIAAAVLYGRYGPLIPQGETTVEIEASAEPGDDEPAYTASPELMGPRAVADVLHDIADPVATLHEDRQKMENARQAAAGEGLNLRSKTRTLVDKVRGRRK